MSELEQFNGIPVGQSAVFHQDREDRPVPSGEQHPFPVKKSGKREVATIQAGGTTSTPVSIEGAENIAFAFVGQLTGNCLVFEVAYAADGPWYRIDVAGSDMSLYYGSTVQNAAGKAVSLSADGLNAIAPWSYLRLVSAEQEAEERQILVVMK